ncbi:MAG TPA: hypothetical protein VHV30_08210 [Polyangiaceae bacterium]|jgi:hypothetical protein|nr:hypothetical protein [Polyangiaceae bacterium]
MQAAPAPPGDGDRNFDPTRRVPPTMGLSNDDSSAALHPRAPFWSYWAEVLLLPFVALFVARLLAEERLLARELRGYADYTRRTRYRLVPGVW